MSSQEITSDFCENLWKQHISKKMLGFVPEKYQGVKPEIFRDILDKETTFKDTVNSWDSKTPDILSRIEPIMNNIKDVDKIAVSISGGVDSMLVSKVLSLWCEQNNVKLILLHINYNNRDCCDIEEKFLNWWAEKYIGCELYINRFTDITRSRNSKERERYEDITRRIRFSFYDYFNCPIILGHNLDDCYENIFSNLSKRIHFDNLFGMSEITVESDITIVRPLLNFTKDEILKQAGMINIPYLEDSTPAWSNRGKMRDTLIPHIKEFNPNIMKGLEEFVRHTTRLENGWNRLFETWFARSILKQTNEGHTNYIISTNDEFYKENYDNINFWVNIWFKNNIPKRPSNKSFKSCIAFIKRNKANMKFQLNNISTLEIIEKTSSLKLTIFDNPF